MRILVDMNLSPAWVEVLVEAGWETSHWSTIGDYRAPDAAIFSYARDHGEVIFTNDLDFGTLLAHTKAQAPSVFQLRTQDLTPSAIGSLVIRALRQFTPQLEAGALLTLDERRNRVRLLPLA